MRGVFEILLSNEVVSEASITQLIRKHVPENVHPHIELVSQQVIEIGSWVPFPCW